MSCRKSRIVILFLMGLAGLLLPAHATGGTVGSVFHPPIGSPAVDLGRREVALVEPPTISGGVLTLAIPSEHASPLFADGGFFATRLHDRDWRLEFKPSSFHGSRDFDWDFLWSSNSSIPINAVPEPTATALLVAGVLLLGGKRFFEKRN